MKFLVFAFTFLFLSLALAVNKGQAFTLVTVPGYNEVAAYEEIVLFVSDVLRNTGLNVEIVEVPRKRGRQDVNSGKYDAVAVRGIEDASELPNLLTTRFPIAFNIYRIYYLQENKSWTEKHLSSYQGATVLNNSSIQAISKSLSLKVTEVNVSYPDLIKILLRKRVDYVVVPEAIMTSLQIKDLSLKKSICVSQNILTRGGLYFSINKKHKNLLPEIEANFLNALLSPPHKFKHLTNFLNRTPK